MIILTVTKKTYKKGSPWEKLSIDASNNLLASIDIEDDILCPVEELDPGKFIFTEDLTVFFYYLTSDEPTDEQDFAILEVLNCMAQDDPKELRYWFHDLTFPDDYILETSWTAFDSDGDSYLCFEKVYAANLPEEKELDYD